MANPDFSKVWAKNSPLTPYEFTDSDYLEGWNFVGSTPPARGMFDALQKQNDEKFQYLENNTALNLLQRTKHYVVGDIAYHKNLPSWAYLKCIVEGDTASVEPTLASRTKNEEFIDGSVKWKVCDIKSGAGAKVGDIKAIAYTGTIEEGWLLCDGASVQKVMYSDLYTAIGDTYGSVDSDHFNLPNLVDKFIEGTSTNAGNYKSAGLPNITGLLGSRLGYFSSLVNDEIWLSGSGALGKTGMQSSSGRKDTIRLDSGDQTTSQSEITFDASKSNSIYGGSTTVQPPALCLRYIICYEEV